LRVLIKLDNKIFETKEKETFKTSDDIPDPLIGDEELVNAEKQRIKDPKN